MVDRRDRFEAACPGGSYTDALRRGSCPIIVGCFSISGSGRSSDSLANATLESLPGILADLDRRLQSGQRIPTLSPGRLTMNSECCWDRV